MLTYAIFGNFDENVVLKRYSSATGQVPMENPLSLHLQNTIKTGRNLNFENETC